MQIGLCKNVERRNIPEKEGFSLSLFLLWFLIFHTERSDRSSLFDHVNIVVRPGLWREKKRATIRATGKLAGSPATEIKNTIDGTFGNAPPCFKIYGNDVRKLDAESSSIKGLLVTAIFCMKSILAWFK